MSVKDPYKAARKRRPEEEPAPEQKREEALRDVIPSKAKTEPKKVVERVSDE